MTWVFKSSSIKLKELITAPKGSVWLVAQHGVRWEPWDMHVCALIWQQTLCLCYCGNYMKLQHHQWCLVTGRSFDVDLGTHIAQDLPNHVSTRVTMAKQQDAAGQNGIKQALRARRGVLRGWTKAENRGPHLRTAGAIIFSHEGQRFCWSQTAIVIVPAWSWSSGPLVTLVSVGCSL